MKHYHINMLAISMLLTCTIAAVSSGNGYSAKALYDKCTDDFTKVAPCLSFATGEAEVPIKDCCGAVEEIKSKNPVCLCFFMEQALNNSDASKNMGIHGDRLLKLPSACKLTNASVSFCPKLLNLPANSPEYKIFSNVSSVSSSIPPKTTASGDTLPLTNTKSSGSMFEPQISSPLSIFVAFILYLSWAQGPSLSNLFLLSCFLEL